MNERQFLITEDGSHTLYVPELDETFHSTHGAISESNYVYLERGLKYYCETRNKKSIRIFEVGFGTGLNAFLSAIHATSNNLLIRYESIEPFPLHCSDYNKLNYTGLIDFTDSEKLFSKIHECTWGRLVEILPEFLLQKVKVILQEYEIHNKFDICFYDAFAPSKQPEMWNINMLEKIWNLLATDGVFVTYCAKGQLKRDLKSLGFVVESLPGPKGKFEIVRATKI